LRSLACEANAAAREVRWAIEHAPSEVREILLQMTARQAGKSRLDVILYALDAGIRASITRSPIR
jgi:hypothetical protein